MLTLYGAGGASTTMPPILPRDVVWIDLDTPEPAEFDIVRQATGLRLPTFDELSEIERSSRLRSENGALYLSMPVVHRSEGEAPRSAPVGFVLTPERLITVRFGPLASFRSFGEKFEEAPTVYSSAAETFAGLIEAIVDRLADILEEIASDLDRLSHRLYGNRSIGLKRRHNPSRHEADLRVSLRRLGHAGDLGSKIRDSTHGIARILPYVVTNGAAWVPPKVKLRLDVVSHDVNSLSDYDMHLANKVQFLLDTTLGLINIEQNNIIKVLTVVSVVGVPPTLVASIYGMNFHNMPELDWSWGYPYGLAMIVISAILPLVWFRWRGWF
jgi:magnesium transporter